jgi:predicted nucleic acid-binding protein
MCLFTRAVIKAGFTKWAVEKIAWLVSAEGAVLSMASLAELCAEDRADVPEEIRNFGVQLLDLPAAAAIQCGEAYRNIREEPEKRIWQGRAKMPLPDFFIGAHAELLGLEVVTNDADRYRAYFPSVRLVTP